jgi:hypothetical protein
MHSVTRIIKVEDWQLFRKSSTMPTGEFIFSEFLVIEEIDCALMYFRLILSVWDSKGKHGSYYRICIRCLVAEYRATLKH